MSRNGTGNDFKAVVLDLYDTIVKWDPASLPTLEWRGRTVRSTAPWLLPLLQERLAGRVDPDAYFDAYHAVYGEIIKERDAAGIEITCHQRFVRTFRRLGLDEDQAAQLATEFSRVHMAGVRRVTSAPDERAWAVRRLAPFYRLGLLSNFDDSQTGREVLLDTGTAHLFEAVIISADVGLRKPNPRIFERILTMLDLAPGEILFVGDTPEHDVLGANRAGMRTAWISAGKGALSEGIPAPDFVINDLAELPALLGC
jgi:HAD superfamily hydrolase (TIGR01549 family)